MESLNNKFLGKMRISFDCQDKLNVNNVVMDFVQINSPLRANMDHMNHVTDELKKMLLKKAEENFPRTSEWYNDAHPSCNRPSTKKYTHKKAV